MKTPFARALSGARQNAGISQADLAATLGVSRSLIAQWETGRSPVTERHRAPLCAAIGLTALPSPDKEPAMRDLYILSSANGFTLWHYKAHGRTLAQTAATGFFDPAADMLAAGDMIMISATDGGKVAYVVSASEAGGVVLAP